VNDFLAVGYGLLTLDKRTDCITLQHGNGNSEGMPIACIGAGTGLGQCYLTASKDSSNNIVSINTDDTNWASLCEKSSWAKKYNISWDGVTNNNSC
jgi:glucokinase